MVSLRLSGRASATAAGAAAGTAALIVAAACARDRAPQLAVAGDTSGIRIAMMVQLQYRAPDIVPAGAFRWVGLDGVTYVLVDVQSAIQGLVQARVDLWIWSVQGYCGGATTLMILG